MTARRARGRLPVCWLSANLVRDANGVDTPTSASAREDPSSQTGLWSANLGGVAFHRDNNHWACQLLFPGEDLSGHEMMRPIVATGAQNDVISMVLG